MLSSDRARGNAVSNGKAWLSVPVFAVSRPRHRWRVGAWQEQLRQDLDLVRSWIDAGDVDVFLVGGLGLAVRSRRFYRNHADIDLAIFDDDLPAFTRNAGAAGYRWARPVAGMAVSPWHRVDLARDVPEPHPSAPLRLTRLRGSRVERLLHRADFLDVMVLQRAYNGIALLGDDVVVPWEDFFPAVLVAGGRHLWLPNAAYKRHLPARWPRQRRDLRVAALR